MFEIFDKRSWVEIDTKILKKNIDEIKKYLFDNEEMIAVVKANAYGHNDKLFSKELYKLGIKKFAVASLSEAINLREVLDDAVIVILGYTPYSDADKLVKYNLSQAITSIDYLDNLYKHTNGKIKAHIAIDTGMSRIGLNAKDFDFCVKTIERYMDIYDIEGMFTHMASADADDLKSDEYTKMQMERFKPLAEYFKDRIKYIHYKNSSAIIRKLDNMASCVRPGIILYGLYPSDEIKKYIKLEPILSWHSVVTSVRNISKGESVGYNNLFIADKDMKIASVGVGYSDGFRRNMLNKAYVIVNGVRVRVLGRICMDQCMIDVSDVTDVKIGTKVTLIGENHGEYISAEELASIALTNHYDILSNISVRVDRVFK